MNPESLIFDVDGTLWDSVDLVVRGWNLALEEAGREPTCTPEGIRPLFGKTMDRNCFWPFCRTRGRRERRRLMNSCMAWEDRVMQDDPCEIFYPQVRQTLEALSRCHRLFIVSNCQKGYIELLLEKGKLGGLIRDHACFGETGLCKGGDHTPGDGAEPNYQRRLCGRHPGGPGGRQIGRDSLLFGPPTASETRRPGRPGLRRSVS